MRNFSVRYAIIFAATSLALVLAGCAAPATREAMIPTEGVLSKPNHYSVHVRTNGGAETSALSSSNIADADLKAAIEDAVVQSKVFESIIQSQGGDYELSVMVVSLAKPTFGATFTVDMEAAWSLVKEADRKIVLRKSIRSSGTATMGDAFVGVSRLRIAVENAARQNISQGLKAVAELNL